MSRPKHTKAKSATNRLLSALMDEKSNDDIAIAMATPSSKVTEPASHSQLLHYSHPISGLLFSSISSPAPFFSEHYHKPTSMPINIPLALSVRLSPLMDYMQAFHLQFIQHPLYHNASPHQQQMIPSFKQIAQEPLQQNYTQIVKTKLPFFGFS